MKIQEEILEVDQKLKEIERRDEIDYKLRELVRHARDAVYQVERYACESGQ